MDRVPRFFKRGGKSSDRDKELPRPEMDPTRTRRRPRLDRRNAAKDIDYEAASTSSFPDEAVTETSPSYSLVTRSLDLIGDRTSFRIEGTEEGEFDRVCRSLGLTGIDDFAIPAAAWEAMKVRSASDLLPRSRASGLGESPKEAEAGESPKEAEAGESPKEAEAEGMKVESGGIRVRVLGGEVEEEVGSTECSRGINGVRPPLLKPPPVMTLPAAVYTGSTWDLMRDLAPETDRGLVVTRGFDSDNEETDGREVVEDRTDRRVLSESYSFTTSNDDDASSSTTDPTNLSPNIRDPREIRGVWEKGKLLGSGSFGTVYEGIDEGGYFFAVKEVSLLDQGSQGRQSIVQLKQEIALLSQFKHDNIVQYLGSETDDSKLYIFLELVSQGSLMSLYNRYHLRDSQVSAYTRQILNGLKYLHEQNVVHRDIKCANILVDTNGNVKLADFGLAKATKLNDVKSSKGTACWMAPEVVNRKNQGYGLPADIWSLGCTVLEMLTSQIPYSELDSFQAIYRIGKGIPPSVPESLSTDARDFILQCLKVDPSDRPTAAQLLDHPFVKRPLYILSGSASPYIGRRSRDFAPPQL